MRCSSWDAVFGTQCSTRSGHRTKTGMVWACACWILRRNLCGQNRCSGGLCTVIVICNGEPRDTVSGVTLSTLLQELGVVDPHVAVEVNQEVVPRGEHAAFVLSDGDRLEVVKLVGGG